MKPHFLASLLLAFLCTGAVAQTLSRSAQSPLLAQLSKPKTPDIIIEPGALALLKRAVATYKGAKGVRFTSAFFADGKDDGTLRVQLAFPDKFLQLTGTGKNTQRVLLTGGTLYDVEGTEYVAESATPPVNAKQLLTATHSYFGSCFLQMVEGKNPLSALHQIYLDAALYKDVHARTVALAAQTLDGKKLVGVKDIISFENVLASQEKTSPAREVDEVSLWFGGVPLILRRVQFRTTLEGRSTTHVEKITGQQVSPTFAADTFKFDPKGLKLASTQPPVKSDEVGQGKATHGDVGDDAGKEDKVGKTRDGVTPVSEQDYMTRFRSVVEESRRASAELVTKMQGGGMNAAQIFAAQGQVAQKQLSALKVLQPPQKYARFHTLFTTMNEHILAMTNEMLLQAQGQPTGEPIDTNAVQKTMQEVGEEAQKVGIPLELIN